MKKRLCSIITALALCLSLLPVTALADSRPDDLVFDISEGSVKIEQSTTEGAIKVTYGNGQVKDGIPSDRTITVTGSFEKTEGVEKAHGIEVSTSANIKVRDLTIDNSAFAPAALDREGVMDVTGEDTDVTLTLEGETVFRAPMQYFGIQVCDGATLTVEGSGTLTVQGGEEYGASGIAANHGDIIFSGGTVNAIGGALDVEGAISRGIYIIYGNLTISGGTVNAIGGAVNANEGISTGIEARYSNIIISGGVVTARGADVEHDNNESTGIYACDGKLDISGGTVTATGGTGSGSNSKSMGICANRNDVILSGGTFTATGGDKAMNTTPVLGSGMKVSAGSSVENLAHVEYSSLEESTYSGQAVRVEPCTSHKVDGGFVLLDEASHGRKCQWCGFVVDSQPHEFVNGVCSGCDVRMVSYLDEDGVTREHTAFPLPTDTTVWSEGWYAAQGDVTISDTVTVNGDVHLILMDGCNLEVNGGIAGGYGASLTIYGQTEPILNSEGKVANSVGRLTAAGKDMVYESYGITIGGPLTINGGSVTAIGGDSMYSYGIRTMGLLTINGGHVNAIARGMTGAYHSAGIYAYNDITISGNAVVTATATGDSNTVESYGIYDTWGRIVISGGTLTAAGGEAMNTTPVLGSNMKVSAENSDGNLVQVEYSSLEASTYSSPAVRVEPCTSHESEEDPVFFDETYHTQRCKWCGATDILQPHEFVGGVCTGCDIRLFSYLDEDGVARTHTAFPLPTDTTVWSGGWYAVEGDVTISDQVVMNGDVHLILTDGCNLNLQDGIWGSDLTIYGQTEPVLDSKGEVANSVGRLIANGRDKVSDLNYGIGATTLTINGGVVTASGGSATPSFGVGYGSFGIHANDSVTINGGVVTATGDVLKNGDEEIGGYGIFAPSIAISDTAIVTATGEGQAMNSAPSLPAVYQWRTDAEGEYAVSTEQEYEYDETHTYVEFVKPFICTITLDPNYDGGQSDTVITNGKGLITSLPAPTRSGYRFEGWFTAQTGGTEVTETTVFREDTTIYAQWKARSSGGSLVDGTVPANPPTVESPDGGGSVTVSTEDPKKGDQVTITPKPEDGYTVEQIVVTDKNGDPVAVTDNGDGTFSFTQPDGAVNIKVTFMEDNFTLNFFTDVSANAYYYDAVLWAAQNGITGGTSDTTFSPNAPCSRAQIITFLWRAAGSPEPKEMSGFSDVPAGSYYAKAVAWAIENGITGGTGDDTFSPNATCTRAQAMAFIYRAIQLLSGGMKGDWMFLNPFSDVNLESYFGEAVMWAVANGITDGTSTTTFSPGANCTRAQIVTFLYRAFH